jgi:hypothetical protein
MMSTLDEALAARDKDAVLTDWRYHEIMGVYCRFGSLPIAIYQSDSFGGMYMTEIKALKPPTSSVMTSKGPIPSAAYTSTVRVPVGFEVHPGKFPGYAVLARLMHMTADVMQDAYEHVLHHGQGSCVSAWSTN